MTTSSRRPPARQDWEALATNALRTGDLMGARAAYAEAVRHDRRNPQLHFEYAAVLAGLGEIEDATVSLTHALRLKPQNDDAARRLSRLLGRFVIEDPSRLEPFGLKAALGYDTVDNQPLAEAALKHLVATLPVLDEAIANLMAAPAADSAHKLIVNRTADVLKSDLLLTALQRGVVTDVGWERLLTALRRALLLDVAPGRFEDRALTAFALALLVQCRNNDHVWAEGDAETAALDQITLDKPTLFAGDLEAGRRLILLLLYRPLESVLAPDDLDAARGIKPKPLRDLVIAELEDRAIERAAMDALPRLAPLSDGTSRRVASQYEASPYPRWQSLHASQVRMMKGTLRRFFELPRLEFMNGGPFDVLIAGAGTGKQALQAAYLYEPQARLLATDISAASLGYAAAAAKRFGINNVDFLVADILDLDRLDRMFDVIECVGVLHHMADPWDGWRRLLARLKPGGLMYIGLYSGVSRANIRDLRAGKDHPGAGCDDRAARAYRADLLARPDGTPGSELKVSGDFYTLNEFRDLLLHESEQHVSLEEIGRFLDANGLVFRGFTLDPSVLDAFAAANPDAPWPGTLQAWAEFERAHPRTFDGMYRFWCERLPAG